MLTKGGVLMRHDEKPLLKENQFCSVICFEAPILRPAVCVRCPLLHRCRMEECLCHVGRPHTAHSADTACWHGQEFINGSWHISSLRTGKSTMSPLMGQL